MNHRREETWLQYVKNELTIEERAICEAHLASCDACFEVYLQCLEQAGDLLPQLEDQKAFSTAVMMRLETQEALWKLLHSENDVIADVFGTEVRLTVLRNESVLDDIIAEIEADPELQQMLLESEEDIKAGKVYTTEEAIRYLREHHSK